MNVYTHEDSVPTIGFDTVIIPAYAPDAPAAARRRAASSCVEYVRELEGFPPVRVIAEFFPDGREEFSEKEFFEVCWHSYKPSEQDRARALKLLLQSGM
jgi:hypothetical protein